MESMTSARGRNPRPEDLEAALKVVEVCWMSGEMSSELYYKALVEIASDYVACCLDIEAGLILVNRIPAEYFGKEMIEQMKQDCLFADSALELTYRFQQLGVLPQTPYDTNQPRGEA